MSVVKRRFPPVAILAGLAAVIAVAAVFVLGGGGGGAALPEPPAVGFTVELRLPGAGLDEVEAGLAIPSERCLGQVRGASRLRATIERGRAVVAVELEPSRGLDEALRDAQRLLSDQLAPLLPQGAEPPELRRGLPGAPPLLQLTLSSDTRSRLDLSSLARTRVVTELARIAGVAAVELEHEVRPAILLRIDPPRLASMDVTLTDLTTALREATTATPEALGGLIVRRERRLDLLLGDLAQISYEADPSTVPATAPATPSVPDPLIVSIRSRPEASPRELLARVRDQLATLRAALPAGVALVEARPSPAPAPSITLSLRGPDWHTLLAQVRQVRDRVGPSTLDDDLRPRPDVTLTPDRTRAAELGVSPHDLATALSAVLGAPIAQLHARDEIVPVIVQLERTGPPARAIAEALDQLYLRGDHAQLVPLSALVKITTEERPARLLRVDRERALEATFTPPPGASRAQLRARLERATRDLPAGYRAVLSP